jgi:hypothetical protein
MPVSQTEELPASVLNRDTRDPLLRLDQLFDGNEENHDPGSKPQGNGGLG